MNSTASISTNIDRKVRKNFPKGFDKLGFDQTTLWSDYEIEPEVAFLWENSVPETPSSYEAESLVNSFSFSPYVIKQEAISLVTQRSEATAIPPDIIRKLEKAEARPRRTLIPIEEWEGYVENIDGDKFIVSMVNLRSKSTVPEEQATFTKDDVSKDQQELIVEGAAVYLTLGRELLPSDQVRTVSELYFPKPPTRTVEDYQLARQKAKALLKGISWENEAET